MTHTFKPHLEILPPSQKRLWLELKPAAELGFVLYGGTAIALRLGHRTSVDFDFFSEKPLAREEIQTTFKFAANSTVLQEGRNTLSLLVPYGDSEHTHVKISFFGGIGFGRVGQPSFTEDGVLEVAALNDLMATKVKVVLQRAEIKDYLDIAEMLKAGVDLTVGIAAARNFFGSSFQSSEVLKALVYYSDGDLYALEEDAKRILVEAVRSVRDLPEVPILSKHLGSANASQSSENRYD
jgi:predicted nucleotidyltransferase component of viral defense system